LQKHNLIEQLRKQLVEAERKISEASKTGDRIVNGDAASNEHVSYMGFYMMCITEDRYNGLS